MADRDEQEPQKGGEDAAEASKPTTTDAPRSAEPSADAPSADLPSADLPSADAPSGDAPSADQSSAVWLAPSVTWPRLAWPAAVFAVTAIVYGLFAWERVKEPSPQFHFVDLAHSLMRGRLDTDTPKRNKAEVAKDPFAPKGYLKAVTRQTTGPDGRARGWNDWASYRTLILKDGQILKGVFPWRDQKDERKFDFYTLDGQIYVINCRRDVKKGCYGNQDATFYVSFPPGPAVVMMPLVALWGYDVNDVLFTIFFGGLNAMVLFLLLQSLSRRGISSRTRGENLWLTALFVFGTVHFFSAVRGEVWFTALVVGVTFHLLAIACAINVRRPLLAGIFMAFALATRAPLAFGCILIGLLAFFPDGKLRREDWGPTLGRLAMFALPVAITLGLLFWYNIARFDSPLEFGHTYLVEGTRNSIRTHGLFSGWFFPDNLRAAFTQPPVITFEGGGPPLRISKHGLGLLWTTPALLLLVGSPNRTWLFKALLITAGVIALPGLFYQNTGWEQFGYRFSLDWLPLLVVAFAVGGRKLSWPVKALILAGVVVNAFGAAAFGRWDQYFYNW